MVVLACFGESRFPGAIRCSTSARLVPCRVGSGIVHHGMHHSFDYELAHSCMTEVIIVNLLHIIDIDKRAELSISRSQVIHYSVFETAHQRFVCKSIALQVVFVIKVSPNRYRSISFVDPVDHRFNDTTTFLFKRELLVVGPSVTGKAPIKVV